MTSFRTDTKYLQKQLFLLTLSDATMGELLVKPCGFIKALGALQRHQTHFPHCPHGLQTPMGCEWRSVAGP